MKQINDKLNWRYATKKFDTEKKISKDQIETLVNTIQLSPSSYGVQPYRIAVIDNQKLKEELQPIIWNQQQVSDSSHIIIFMSRTDITNDDIDSIVKHTAEQRNLDIEDLKGYGDFMKEKIISENTEQQRKDWAARQAYIAVGNVLNAAAELKIDACPMEGFEGKELDKKLNLKEKGLQSVVVVALGYRSEDDENQHYPKVRRPLSELKIEI